MDNESRPSPPSGKALDFLHSAPPFPLPLPLPSWQPRSRAGSFPDAEWSQGSEALFPASRGLLCGLCGLSFPVNPSGGTEASVPLGHPTASHHPPCGCPTAQAMAMPAEQRLHLLGTPFLLPPQHPPANCGGDLKQQKLYCNYTIKPQNTLQSSRGVRVIKKRREGQWGNACLQKQVLLHAGCKLLSSCELLLKPSCLAAAPYHSRGSSVCAATGRGLRAAGPKGATEEREKLMGSQQCLRGGLKRQPLAPRPLRRSGQVVKVFLPWGSGSGELGGQSRETVRAQPRLQHWCLPLPAPAMPWAMRTRGPAQRPEQLSSMMLNSPAPQRPSLGEPCPG